MAQLAHVFETPQAPKQFYNVAVIEDDLDDFVLVSRFLEYSQRAEFNLTHISSFTEAKERLVEEEFDAALVDQYLSGWLGIDLVKELGGRNAPLPLIMLTGNSTNVLDSSAMEAGVADFIDKFEMTSSILARSIIYSQSNFAAEKQLRLSQARLNCALSIANAAKIAKSENLESIGRRLKLLLSPINILIETVGLSGTRKGAFADKVKLAADTDQSDLDLRRMIEEILDLTENDLIDLTPQNPSVKAPDPSFDSDASLSKPKTSHAEVKPDDPRKQIAETMNSVDQLKNKPVDRSTGKNPFRAIHKALSARLFEVAISAGRTDFSTEATASVFVDKFHSLKDALRRHSKDEDKTLHPLLKTNSSDDFEETEQQHSELDAALTDLETGLTHIFKSEIVEERRLRAHAFYLQFLLFTARYLAHIFAEETVLLGEIRNSCVEEDFTAIAKQQYSPISPNQLEALLGKMLPYINTEDMLTMFEEFKTFLPRKTLLMLSNSLEPSLPKTDWGRLTKVVG